MLVGHVVFDLDGVLVDSEPAHEQATADYLAGLGVTVDPVLAERMMGRRVRDYTDALAARLGLEPDEVFAGREALFWAAVRRGLPAMPGLHLAVERLAAAGLRLAVASSGTRAYVDHVLGRLGIRDSFAAVVSGEDVVHSKPDPESYLLAAKRLEAGPAACAAVEDAPNGIAAARAAGMYTIAVPHLLSGNLAGADAVLPSLEAVADHILDG